jgi:hypothetical protein
LLSQPLDIKRDAKRQKSRLGVLRNMFYSIGLEISATVAIAVSYLLSEKKE